MEQEAALGRVVDLPQPLTRLPREKPLPKPKPPTRWERFAKEKGIQKRQKRSSQVWDENSGSWKRRHGHDRVAAGSEQTAPVVDAKPWETTGVEDPFSLQVADKKQRVSAQSGRQANNLAAAAKAGARHVPGRATVNLPPLLAGGGDRNSSLKKAASLARVSTASMGASRVGQGPCQAQRRVLRAVCPQRAHQFDRGSAFHRSKTRAETNAGERPWGVALCAWLPTRARHPKRRSQATRGLPPGVLLCG
jgi:hypothetical protein